MRIVVISGSHRKNSQSEKVSRYIINRQIATHSQSKAELINLANNPIPLWDESMDVKKEPWKSHLQPSLELLQSCDGVVWVIPEWNGMIPSGVSNLLQHCTAKELGHKPALLVGISASMNGVYPISQMRLNSSKNNRGVYLPEHIIIRYVEKVLNDPEKSASGEDSHLRGRIDYCLSLLNLYAQHMKPIRHSSIIDYDRYPNGM